MDVWTYLVLMQNTDAFFLSVLKIVRFGSVEASSSLAYESFSHLQPLHCFLVWRYSRLILCVLSGAGIPLWQTVIFRDHTLIMRGAYCFPSFFLSLLPSSLSLPPFLLFFLFKEKLNNEFLPIINCFLFLYKFICNYNEYYFRITIKILLNYNYQKQFEFIVWFFSSLECITLGIYRQIVVFESHLTCSLYKLKPC